MAEPSKDATNPPSRERNPRQRRFGPKTGTGCKTCRLRRVKCGEERPRCQRCVSTGRVCEGYESIRLAETSTDNDGIMTLKWVRPLSHPPGANEQEQIAFDYFRTHLLETLPGPFDPSVWYRQVLPISTTEPTVRHAVIALGSVRRPNSEGRMQGTNHFALEHYSKAMRALQNTIAERRQIPPDLALVTCLLFVAFEFQHSGYIQAILHLEGGLKIIREFQNERQSSPPLSKQTSDPLVEAFERLDIQMSLFTSRRVHLNQAVEDARMTSLPVEMELKGIGDASRTHNLQMAAMRELMYTIEAKRFSLDGLSADDYVFLQTQQTRQLVSLGHWDRAMNDLLPRLVTEKDQQAGKILQAHHICCKLMVSTCLTDGREMLWDSFLPDFERLLQLAEEVVQIGMLTRPGNETNALHGFSLDAGVIPPAYFAVLKCRGPGLRRRGLAVLQTCKHQEGAWNGPLSTRLAESIVKLEERGLEDIHVAAGVPEQNRLYQAWYDLTVSDKIVYCKRRRFELDGSWIDYQEHIA